MTGYTGIDTFTFQADNGVSNSEPALVSIRIVPWSGDITPPEIFWTYPADGQELTGISTTPVFTDSHGPAYAPAILVQFSEAISPTTVTTDTIQVIENYGQAISITVTYNGINNQAVIIPRQALDVDTNYTALVKKTVEDLIGNAMTANFSWQFSNGTSTFRIFLPQLLR